MELFNLLEKVIPVFGQTYDVSLSWIGQLIQLLISGVGVVGVGIILFSLILKLIVLPFDVFQRISMRKQNIKMEEQKERMEKLQKQYANNKELYNQKLMEMYKENGISMFSSCLPMILSMVIFFVAIGAFNAYSQYSNVQNYNELANAYNAKIESYCPDLNTATPVFENGKLVVKGDADDYIYYRVPAGEYTAESDLTSAEAKAYILNSKEKEYLVDTEKVEAANIEEIALKVTAENPIENAAYDYFVGQAQDAVLTAYETTVSKNTNFLWIKNVWATDAAHVHPMVSFSEFEAGLKSGGGCGSCFGSRNIFNVDGEKVIYGDLQKETGTRVYTEDAYKLITGKLTTQKEEANGYYILIVLSIATILLQQFVSMRSQKAQNKYSTVDGQGASQQTMMMVIMTGMFAVFSFMYSSAFSLYMITSNIFSLISTLAINKLVDVKMEKKSAKEATVKLDNRGLSRIEAAKNAGKESAKESREKKAEKEDKKEDK